MKKKIIIGVHFLLVIVLGLLVWRHFHKSHPKELDSVIFMDVTTDPGMPENFKEGMDLRNWARQGRKYKYGFLQQKWFYFCSKNDNNTDDAAKEMVAFLQTFPGVTDVENYSPPNSDIISIIYKTPSNPYGSLQFYSKAYHEKYLASKRRRNLN